MRIFTKNFQILGKKRNQDGIGLGLFIVKNIITAIGGNIQVASKLYKGTTFTVTLPFTEESSTNSQYIAHIQPYINFNEFDLSDSITNKPHSLLLVEDQLDLLSLMRGHLKADYNIYSATNGIEALDKLTNQQIDLVISDVMMDGMDGLELVEIMSQQPSLSHIPIFLLTAKNSYKDQLVGTAKGAIQYIPKPVEMPYLSNVIAAYFSNEQSKLAAFQQSINAAWKYKGLPLHQHEMIKTISTTQRIDQLDLTPKQKEVCKYLVEHPSHTYREMAEDMYISENTIKTHIKTICSKLDVLHRKAILIDFLKSKAS